MADRFKENGRRIHAGLTELRQLAGNPSVPTLSLKTSVSRATLYRLFDPTSVGHIDNPKVSTFLSVVEALKGTPDDIDSILTSSYPLKRTISNIRVRHGLSSQDPGTAMVGPLKDSLSDPEILKMYRKAETLSDDKKAFIIDAIRGLVEQRKKRKAGI